MKKIVVIGAGPAGLAAADKLCQSNVPVTIIEKEDCVGGLSRTINHKGSRFDIGSHRFYTKSPQVFLWWQGVLGGDFLKRPRQSRIYYKKRFFNYPLSAADVLSKLGLADSVSILLSYLNSKLFPHREEDCFEKFISNRFGEKLYRIFFRDYTEKVWGMPCSQISADWASQRIKGLSLLTALNNALFPLRKNNIKTLIREFYYPRLGAGMMYEEVSKRVIRSGGELRLLTEVVNIRHGSFRVTGLICKDRPSGRIFEVPGTDFLSSMPLPQLLMRMQPALSDELIDSCQRLHFRSLIMVYLIIAQEGIFKDNWIYVNSNDVLAGRISNYNNWGPGMSADASKTSLGLEYFCTEGDKLWLSSDEELIALAKDELHRVNLGVKGAIEDAFILRVPNAYPVYDKDYRRSFKKVKDFVTRFQNLQCIGRYGMFRYNNMDHSILTGFLAAKNILGGSEDVWGVNTDCLYHEELEES